jgi:para-aminobenzoate synthetase
MLRTLLIDNYDSFTLNLYHLIAVVSGRSPILIRNDEMDLKAVLGLPFRNIVISPGPGRPEKSRDFGICGDLIKLGTQPILGVCLGHQGIADVLGGQVRHAPKPMHGQISQIYHTASDLFDGVASPFLAVRYHSLIVESLPPCLEKTAWTAEGLVMALRHRSLPLWGVQFHPESICTEFGAELMENFLAISRCRAKSTGRLKTKAPAARAPFVQPSPKEDGLLPNGDKLRVRVRKLTQYVDPESVFVTLHGKSQNSFWLDSCPHAVSGGRFSFMGDTAGPNGSVIRYRLRDRQFEIRQNGRTRHRAGNLFDTFRDAIRERTITCDEPLPFDFQCGVVGYFGYELKAQCGGGEGRDSTFPDAAFIVADRFVAFDHHQLCMYLVCLETGGESTQEADDWFESTAALIASAEPPEPPAMRYDADRAAFRRPLHLYSGDVEACQEYIRDGESYEICLTNEIIIDARVDPLEYYRTLRRANPAPFAAFLKFDDFAISATSPELFLRVDARGVVMTKPIKGTIRRSRDCDEDAALRETLRTSEKDRAEHLMIVDLLRNDLGRHCKPGSIGVEKLMDIESYQSVHQMVSTVKGELRDEASSIDCLQAAFPGGSMTGAPKLRTLEIIDELEGRPRGIYSGCLGWIGLNGAMTQSIVIRTAVISEDTVAIGSGGAITILSDPTSEIDELLLKANALLKLFEFDHPQTGSEHVPLERVVLK